MNGKAEMGGGQDCRSLPFLFFKMGDGGELGQSDLLLSDDWRPGKTGRAGGDAGSTWECSSDGRETWAWPSRSPVQVRPLPLKAGALRRSVTPWL